MVKSVIILAVVAALMLSQNVSALQCYQCSGAITPTSNCVTLQFATPGFCGNGRVCAEYTLTKGTTDVLTRACAPADICTSLETQYATNPNVNVKTCRTCDEDACNS